MGQKIHIYDCFPFFNELDLLEIRLNELASTVHRFVIAEAPTTFTGRPKPLYFADNRSRFADFADRIIHIIVKDTPEHATSWPRQYHQRNALARGVAEASAEDLILLSDVDELPRRNVLEEILVRPPTKGEVICLELRMFCYFVNLESPARWLRSGPRVLRKGSLTTMQSLREVKGPAPALFRDWVRELKASWLMGRPVRRRLIADAGWHFSYLGGVAAVAQKAAAISGSAKLGPEFQDTRRIAELIGRASGVRPGDPKLTLRPIDSTLPPYFCENANRFRNLVADSQTLANLLEHGFGNEAPSAASH